MHHSAPIEQDSYRWQLMPATENRQPVHSLARPALASAALAIASMVVALRVDAACLPSSNPMIQRYEQQMGTDPAGVARIMSEQLASQTSDASNRLALYAVLADAQSSLENPAEAVSAANSGLALINDPHDAIYINLTMYRAASTLDKDGVQRELESVETLRKQQIPGSPEEACLLVSLAYLQLSASHPDQASTLAARAYHLSRGTERQRQRAMAADVLSVIVRDLRDFEQALKLNQEVIDWDMQRGAIFDLSTTRYIRGSILRDMRDYKGSLIELEEAKKLATQFEDILGAAYNNVLMCMSHIELGNIAVAHGLCDEAYKVFVAEKADDPAKIALESLALIDVKEGRPARALQRINSVLDQQGRDLVPRRMARIYEIRAKTYEALGQSKLALTDYKSYMERFRTVIDADRMREAAALRVRYETDREIERSAALQRELAIQNGQLEARSAQLKWMMIAAIACVSIVALLTYFLHINRKQKRLLVQLAQYDELTGLANRRHTLDVARTAFDRARKQSTPLTIGIVDIDYFKKINDRCGHAVGDAVLREFASVGRAALRENDTLGRWGGEEFLVVLPGITLDVALGVVERLREAALRMQVPGLTIGMRVTVSSGLATIDGDFATLEEVIAQADAALYEAKNSGRDLVCIAPESYSLASTGVRRVLKSSGIAMQTGQFPRFKSG